MQSREKVEVKLGNVVLSYDRARPGAIEVTPAERPVRESILESATKLARMMAFRHFHPEHVKDMTGIMLDDRIRRELIHLRESGEIETAGEMVGYYQKLKAQPKK